MISQILKYKCNIPGSSVCGLSITNTGARKQTIHCQHSLEHKYQKNPSGAQQSTMPFVGNITKFSGSLTLESSLLQKLISAVGFCFSEYMFSKKIGQLNPSECTISIW